MDNIVLKQKLTDQQLLILQSELDKKKKSKAITYLFWCSIGVLGGHRFYLGDVGMGLAMLFTLGGLGVWAFIDVFFIGKRVEELTDKMELELIRNLNYMNNPV